MPQSMHVLLELYDDHLLSGLRYAVAMLSYGPRAMVERLGVLTFDINKLGYWPECFGLFLRRTCTLGQEVSLLQLIQLTEVFTRAFLPSRGQMLEWNRGAAMRFLTSVSVPKEQP